MYVNAAPAKAQRRTEGFLETLLQELPPPEETHLQWQWYFPPPSVINLFGPVALPGNSTLHSSSIRRSLEKLHFARGTRAYSLKCKHRTCDEPAVGCRPCSRKLSEYNVTVLLAFQVIQELLDGT
jgi:hypothetical protein